MIESPDCFGLFEAQFGAAVKELLTRVIQPLLRAVDPGETGRLIRYLITDLEELIAKIRHSFPQRAEALEKLLLQLRGLTPAQQSPGSDPLVRICRELEAELGAKGSSAPPPATKPPSPRGDFWK